MAPRKRQEGATREVRSEKTQKGKAQNRNFGGTTEVRVNPWAWGGLGLEESSRLFRPEGRRRRMGRGMQGRDERE